MKIRIELEENLQEEEIVIRCRELTEEVLQIQKAIVEKEKEFQDILLFKDKTEYYYPLKEILFFETQGDMVYAHTKTESFSTEFKLYALEDFLPDSFLRISKSTIVNLEQIYSITRNVTASSEIKFWDTHKQAYVSRNYYKQLRTKLEEKRMKR